MKCHDVHQWLLASQPNEVMPKSLASHLTGCGSCRRWRGRLRLLEQRVSLLPPPPTSSSVRAQLSARLDAHPRIVSPPLIVESRPAALRPRRRGVPWLVACAATVAAAVFGWWIGHASIAVEEPIPPSVSKPKPIVPVSVDRPIAVRLAELDVLLASAESPSERVDGVARLANELEEEAFRLARQGPMENLPQVVSLYSVVAEGGLTGQMRTLTAEQREQIVPFLVEQLQATESRAQTEAKNALPTLAEQFQRLVHSARDTVALLKGVAQTKQSPALPAGEDLLSRLVRLGLRLAEEGDPLRRAEVSLDLSAHLTQAIVLLSADGHTEQAVQLGEQLGELMDQGVADNLDRVSAADPDPERKVAVERVRQQAIQATTMLEKNLAQAPAAARAGLEQAMEASRDGRDRAVKGGKPKDKAPNKVHGPPWKRDKDAPGKVPPGHQKPRR